MTQRRNSGGTVEDDRRSRSGRRQRPRAAKL